MNHKTIGARELKQHLGAYLREVRRGTTLIITDRGNPIARLAPVVAGRGADEVRQLEHLHGMGIISRAASAGGLPPATPVVWDGPPLSAAILEDRDTDR